MRSLIICITTLALSVPTFADNCKTAVKALLITGGCCHDYDNQKTIIPAGVKAHTDVEIEWTVIHEGGTAHNVEIPFYTNPDWAKGYDVVVHNECFANIANADFIQGILAPHRAGLPAVLIHCSMHSYRSGTAKEDWWKFCGVHSPKHGPKHPFEVEVLNADHEVTQGLSNWTTPKGELYYIQTTYPGITPLAHAKSNATGEMHMNIWTHEYGPAKARVFGTTIGHHNETMEDPAYQDMLTRGLLWALGKPVEEHLVK